MVIDPVCTVLDLNLTAEAGGIPGPFGIGVPAVPFSLVQSDPVGGGGSGSRAAGQALGALFMVSTQQQEKQTGQSGGGIGQTLTFRYGQYDGVSQREYAAQRGQCIHADPALAGVDDTAQQNVDAQQGSRGHHARGEPALYQGIAKRGHENIPQGGNGQLYNGQQAQQKQKDQPQPGGLQTLQIGACQLLRRGIRRWRRCLFDLFRLGGGLRLILFIGAGDEAFQTANLLGVDALVLLIHPVGVIVGPAVDVLNKGGQHPVVAVGLFRVLLPGFSGEGDHLRGTTGRHGIIRQIVFREEVGFLRGFHFRFRRGQLVQNDTGKGHHVGLLCLFGGGHRDGAVAVVGGNAVFGQDVVQLKISGVGVSDEGFDVCQIVGIIRFFGISIAHGRLLAWVREDYPPIRWRTASYSSTAAAAEAFRELILPNMGMETVKSQVSVTRRPMPSPSLPMTMAAGPFKSAL